MPRRRLRFLFRGLFFGRFLLFFLFSVIEHRLDFGDNIRRLVDNVFNRSAKVRRPGRIFHIQKLDAAVSANHKEADRRDRNTGAASAAKVVFSGRDGIFTRIVVSAAGKTDRHL